MLQVPAFSVDNLLVCLGAHKNHNIPIVTCNVARSIIFLTKVGGAVLIKV